jgi:hypothetical protein
VKSKRERTNRGRRASRCRRLQRVPIDAGIEKQESHTALLLVVDSRRLGVTPGQLRFAQGGSADQTAMVLRQQDVAGCAGGRALRR